jgi:hypothetical protein
VAKVLKSSYFPKQDWNDVFTSVNMRELPRMAGDLFNRVSEGRQLVWAFNEGHRQKISLLAIIPSLMALSALDLSEDGTIEGVRCDMRSLGSEQMMAHVRSNFDATHVLLSPNTDRRPHAMRVELPPYQTIFAKAALCAGSGLVNFQGQVFAATDRRPPEKTGRQIGHIMDGKAPITYDDVARFEGFRPLELNSNAAKVAFGHRAGLSQHVMNETRQLIVRVGGEEFCFERV